MPVNIPIDMLLPDNLDFQLVYPQIILLVSILGIMLISLFFEEKGSTRMTAFLSVLALAGAGYYSITQLWGAETWAFGNMLIVDTYSVFFNILFALAGILAIMSSVRYIERADMNHGEYYIIILGAVFGMMIMAAAGNLLTIFVGIEMLSIPLYILAGFERKRAESNEAALKYLLLGAFATGFLLYGIALIYGTTGELDLVALARYIETHGAPGTMMLIGMAFVIVGISFKASLVPFHMWAPDVYQGAPTPITGFMSTAAKAAAFALFFRVLAIGFPMLHASWHSVLYVLAIATMTVGNLTAINQTNIKRMLAFSSISHAGYLVIAILAAGRGVEQGANSIPFYLLAYTMMNMGAFGILAAMARKNQPNDTLSAFAGLAQKHPALAAAMTICMLSLAGIPPTAGFIGKFYIFSAAVKADMIPLVIIGVLNAVVSVYYYLRVVVAMYMNEPEIEIEGEPASWPAAVSIAVCVIGILIMGILPSVFIAISRSAILAQVWHP